MNKRKIAWLALFGLVAAIIVLSIASRTSKETGFNNGTQTQPQGPVEPSSGPNPSVNESDGSGQQSKDNQLDAVRSAAEAMNALAVAPFLPDAQLTETVNFVVAPESRKTMLDGYTNAKLPERPGVILAARWNYGSLEEALSKSELRISAEQYKVKSFDSKNGQATVALFTVTHFALKKVEPDFSERFCVFGSDEERPPATAEAFCKYDVPAINVVKMRWVENRWLYVGKAELSPSEKPKFNAPVETLQPQEVRSQYKPLLEKGGYRAYVG